MDLQLVRPSYDAFDGFPDPPPESGRVRYAAEGLIIDMVPDGEAYLMPVNIEVSHELAQDTAVLAALTRIFPWHEIRIRPGTRSALDTACR